MYEYFRESSVLDEILCELSLERVQHPWVFKAFHTAVVVLIKLNNLNESKQKRVLTFEQSAVQNCNSLYSNIGCCSCPSLEASASSRLQAYLSYQLNARVWLAFVSSSRQCCTQDVCLTFVYCLFQRKMSTCSIYLFVCYTASWSYRNEAQHIDECFRYNLLWDCL